MRETHELRVAGAPVALRRHPRARRLRLSLDAAGALHLTLPARTPLHAAQAFLDAQQAWAERALERSRRPGVLGLDVPGCIGVLGERRRVTYREAPRASVRSGAVLVASGPTREAAAAALERWARRELGRRAEPLVAAEAGRLGLAAPRLSVRGQRGRWGSASARTRTLALNWRLLLGTEQALDYVVVHELCHFREMTHGPRFWALVERARPDWRIQRDWLAAHQAELMRWSALRALEG